MNFNLTNPDGSTVPRDPTNNALGNIQIPLPIYRLVTVGGDTSFTGNIEYRIPIINQVTFSLFTDFNTTFDARPSQLQQSALGSSSLSSPLYGCPVFANGACSGGTQLTFPRQLAPHPAPTLCHGCRTVQS